MSISLSIEKQATELFDRHFQRPGSKCVRVFGDWGMGKSSMLSSLAERLNAENRIGIVVAPPIADLDTASAALVQIAQELAAHDLIQESNGVDAIRDPRRPFRDKVDSIAGVLRSHGDRVVLLCDEPSRWAIRERDDVLFYAESNRIARSLARQLTEDFECSRVIAEQSWDGITQEPYHHLLRPSNSDSAAILDDFQDEFDEIVQKSPKLLANKSFLHLRLLAAFKAVGGDPFQDVWERDHELAVSFIRFLKEAPGRSRFLHLLAKLPLVRGPISDSLLTVLGYQESFPPLEKRLIKHCFLSEAAYGDHTLHPAVRHAISTVLPLPTERLTQTHLEIANYYSAKLKSLRFANQIALDVEYQGFDQEARAGLATVERFSHFFAAQLHVLGRTLSRDMKLYREAASVFRLATQEDDHDDYGNHYAAYNLDLVAEEEDEVEQRYRKAVELNFSHPWYWSRWINFLITTGRMQEAYKEWAIALNVLSSPGNEDSEIFDHLHFWVAQLLLYRAQLEFAERVLDDVDPKVRVDRVRFIELDRLLKALKIAREERPVFPSYIDPASYWSRYPHLDQPLRWNNRHLENFNSARVEQVNDDCVSIIVGKCENDEVRYGAISIPRVKFDESAIGFSAAELVEGRYVELSFYGDDQFLRIDLYPADPPIGSVLPPLDPPNPNRYLEGWNPRV